MNRLEVGSVVSAAVTALGVLGWLLALIPRETAWRLWALGGFATTAYLFAAMALSPEPHQSEQEAA